MLYDLTKEESSVLENIRKPYSQRIEEHKALKELKKQEALDKLPSKDKKKVVDELNRQSKLTTKELKLENLYKQKTFIEEQINALTIE